MIVYIGHSDTEKSNYYSDEDDYEDSFINDSDVEVSPPSPAFSSEGFHPVVSTLAGVHPESFAFFTQMAEKLIEEHGTNALAAALAQFSGFAQPPSARSLITHEQGRVILQLIRESGATRGFLSSRSVMGFLFDVYRSVPDEVGKILLIADERVQGAGNCHHITPDHGMRFNSERCRTSFNRYVNENIKAIARVSPS